MSAWQGHTRTTAFGPPVKQKKLCGVGLATWASVVNEVLRLWVRFELVRVWELECCQSREGKQQYFQLAKQYWNSNDFSTVGCVETVFLDFREREPVGRLYKIIKKIVAAIGAQIRDLVERTIPFKTNVFTDAWHSHLNADVVRSPCFCWGCHPPPPLDGAVSPLTLVGRCCFPSFAFWLTPFPSFLESPFSSLGLIYRFVSFRLLSDCIFMCVVFTVSFFCSILFFIFLPCFHLFSATATARQRHEWNEDRHDGGNQPQVKDLQCRGHRATEPQSDPEWQLLEVHIERRRWRYASRQLDEASGHAQTFVSNLFVWTWTSCGRRPFHNRRSLRSRVSSTCPKMADTLHFLVTRPITMHDSINNAPKH